MLKTIALQNFVHFKDKTVIELDTSQRRKQSKATSAREAETVTNFGADLREMHQEETSSNASAKKIRRLDAVKEVIASCNSLNIFVGANFCGKSTVLELIRRCMTDKINVSVTKSFNDNDIAYAFCKFSLEQYDEVISGIIKTPGDNSEVHKVFIFAEKQEYFLRTRLSGSDSTCTYLIKSKNEIETIKSIFKKADQSTSNNIRCLIGNKGQLAPEKSIAVQPSWETIEDKYVSTLPLRGIGMVQWTKSNNINDKTVNYRMACERAQVISTLLFGDGKDDIDEELEREIFQFVTYPERFTFTKNDKEGLIYVKHNESEPSFPLIKTSEGILEAKLTSLLLAHKGIHTLCLEDPDRGMHPQMIERLKTKMHMQLTSYKKTIIVVTHSPYFIDTITIDKTHVFFRKKIATNTYECSVKNAGKSEELSKVSDIETMRTLLFSTKVLLVEGVTDREVVEGIFTHIKRKAIEKKDIELLNKDITTYQVIPVHGCENTKKIQTFCNYINLTCLCLWDLDKVVRCDGNIIKEFLEIDAKSKNIYENEKKYKEKDLSTFIDNGDSLKVVKLLESNRKRPTFIWRHGAIENAILSSTNCNEEIRNSLLKCSDLNSAFLKKKLKKRLHEEEREKFYAEVVKVDEINRFLEFLWDHEGV